MTAAELIEALKLLPPDVEVWHVWDGEPRTVIEHVWLSRDGRIITADRQENVYSDAARPAEAPREADDRHWSTP